MLLIPILVAILICLYMFRCLGVPVSVDAKYELTWLIILCVVLFVLLILVLVAILICLYMFRCLGVPRQC